MAELLDKQQAVQDVDLFVLDMDGTFYLGDRLIEGSLEFIEKVKKAGKRFVFFTNNSSRIPSFYQQKLERMGCLVTTREVITSGDVTINWLQATHPGKKVYLVGTPLLEQSFREGGICLVEEAPDIVVVGFDTTLTYEKLEKACTFIRRGALFIATHLDINCPTEDGFIPDCGAMCALITKSTGVEPRYLGKHHRGAKGAGCLCGGPSLHRCGHRGKKRCQRFFGADRRGDHGRCGNCRCSPDLYL